MSRHFLLPVVTLGLGFTSGCNLSLIDLNPGSDSNCDPDPCGYNACDPWACDPHGDTDGWDTDTDTDCDPDPCGVYACDPWYCEYDTDDWDTDDWDTDTDCEPSEPLGVWNLRLTVDDLKPAMVEPDADNNPESWPYVYQPDADCAYGECFIYELAHQVILEPWGEAIWEYQYTATNLCYGYSDSWSSGYVGTWTLNTRTGLYAIAFDYVPGVGNWSALNLECTLGEGDAVYCEDTAPGSNDYYSFEAEAL